MLELIVLGQIPGTNIYLSFTTLAALLLVATIAATVGLKHIKKHYTDFKNKQSEVNDQAI